MLSKVKRMLLGECVYYFLMHRDPATLRSKRLSILEAWCEWYVEANGSKAEFCRLVSQNSTMDNLMILELAGDLDQLAKRFKLMDKKQKTKEPF